jgi:MEMO1 family protein
MVDARKPTAAGLYYPSAPQVLARTVRELVDAAAADARGQSPSHPSPPSPRTKRVQAIVAPHGRLAASGPIAAAAWARVIPRAQQVRRVVILGPAHHTVIGGVVAPFAEAFETPLGPVPVDRIAIEAARRWPELALADAPHEHEHALEMQLPFAQTVIEAPAIVPLLVGDVDDGELAAALEAMWNDTTLIVVSTDLSRYHAASAAAALDEATARAVEALDPPAIGPEQACGWIALRALLRVAAARDWTATRVGGGFGTLWTEESAPTEIDEVTGFGAFALG